MNDPLGIDLRTVTLSEAKGLANKNKRFFAEFTLE